MTANESCGAKEIDGRKEKRKEIRVCVRNLILFLYEYVFIDQK